MKCTRCHGSGKEPESELVTGWFPAHVKPARPGIYQKHVDGYIRYATFTGRRWGSWVESIKTAIHPSYQYENTDADHPWRGLKTPNDLGEGREGGILREASSGEAATSTDGLGG